MARRRLKICWPKPDDVCLQGGCIHCVDHESRSIREILDSLPRKRKEHLYERLRMGYKLR